VKDEEEEQKKGKENEEEEEEEEESALLLFSYSSLPVFFSISLFSDNIYIFFISIFINCVTSLHTHA